MARQLRIEFEGALYHITSRGNDQGKIFFGEKDNKKFLEILRRNKEKYGFYLHTYALLSNHYHLLLETPLGNLSQLMQNINTSYAVYINTKYKRCGHLLQGRYKSILVDKDSYLIELSRYIHLNPVRAGMAILPEGYRWSSYHDYLEENKKSLIDTTCILQQFSSTILEARKKYQEFVESAIEAKETPLSNLFAGVILGSFSFREKILKRLGDIKEDRELPSAKSLHKSMEIKDIIDKTSEYFDEQPENLCCPSRNNEKRKMAIYLCKILSRKSNKEIAPYFNIADAAVSFQIQKMESKIQKSPKPLNDLNRLRNWVVKQDQ